MCWPWTEFMCLRRASSGACMDKSIDFRISEKAGYFLTTSLRPSVSEERFRVPSHSLARPWVPYFECRGDSSGHGAVLQLGGLFCGAGL